MLHLSINISDILYCHNSHGWLTTVTMFLAVAGVMLSSSFDTERCSPDTGSCGHRPETGTRHRQDQDLAPGKVQLAANLGPGNILKIHNTESLITGKNMSYKFTQNKY